MNVIDMATATAERAIAQAEKSSDTWSLIDSAIAVRRYGEQYPDSPKYWELFERHGRASDVFWERRRAA